MSIYRRGALDLFNFDRAVSPVEGGVARVDLTEVSFVDAYGLVGLACYIASTSGEGLPVEVVLPDSDDVSSYLARMHLGDVLDAYDVRVEGTLPTVNERDRRDRLIELGRFEDSQGSHRLAEFLWARLDGHAHPQVLSELFEATGELGNNVVEHAGSPAGGFVAAQRFQPIRAPEYLIVAVGDVGIGVRESLRPRYGDMSETRAIELALEWDVSGVNEQGRGQGLPGVIEGVTEFGGRILVRSGAASYSIDQWRTYADQPSHLQGTIVGARLPCRRGG